MGKDTDFDLRTHSEKLRVEGYTVIEDFLDDAGLSSVRSALASRMGRHLGRNAFEGFQTERIYTLVARGKVFEDITENPSLMSLLDGVLLPGYLLTASQSICIYPGEKAQSLHTDDSFYRLPRPRPAISQSLILAIDEFTAENGATEIIPGSHLWSDAEVAGLSREAAEAQLQPVVMPAGAAIVFQGTLLHRGGANSSSAPRLALTNQYCQPWGRTQENFFLGVPRPQVRAMSPRLQALLGYAIWPSFMGHVTASHPLKSLDPDWSPPLVVDP